MLQDCMYKVTVYEKDCIKVIVQNNRLHYEFDIK